MIPIPTNSIKAGFFEISLSGMIAIIVDGTIICANDSAYEIFGYIPDELEGLNITSLMPERFRERHVSHLIEFAQHPKKRIMGKTEDIKIFGLTKTGKEIPMVVNISGKVPKEAGQFVGYADFRLREENE